MPPRSTVAIGQTATNPETGERIVYTGGDPGDIRSWSPAGANASAQHGADFLSTLDPTTADQVRALAEGRMQFPGSMAMRTPYWQGMLRNVAAYDPNFDQVNYGARQRTRNLFTSGPPGNNITAINTAIGHLRTLQDTIANLHNTPFPVVNAVRNFGSNHTGSPRVTNFQAAREAVVSELVRVYRQAGGAEADLQRSLDLLNAANSPEQLNGAIQQTARLLESRVQALQDQYSTGMGTAQTTVPGLNPHAQDALDSMAGAGEDRRVQRSSARIADSYAQARERWLRSWRTRHGNVNGAAAAFDAWWNQRNPSAPGGRYSPPARAPAPQGGVAPTSVRQMSDDEILRLAGGGQ